MSEDTSFLNSIEEILSLISGYVWGLPLIFLLLGTGLFLTIRLGFIQFVELGRGLKLAFSKSDDSQEGDISHFRALMTALAATIGTGNIAGVATAIAAGGPGALFWMWVTAIVGMATKYSEAILAIKYRIKDENGEMVGGPMYALERGLNMKWLGVLFALFAAIAGFGIGNMVQANSVSTALGESFSLPTGISGLVLAVLTAAVLLGGIKRIGMVAGYLVPMMAVIYMIFGTVILVIHVSEIPAALGLVFSDAFTGTAAVGGFAGAMVREVIQQGVARGLFSNESGLGSAPIAAAAARTKIPKQQALVSMTGTFIDTIIVCTMTGLILIVTDVWSAADPLTGEKITGAPLTVIAFREGFPGDYAGKIVAIGSILFAYSTILGWGYYGEKCIEYLCGVRGIKPYRAVWCVMVFVGATFPLNLVWTFSDIMNGLMAVPNLISLLLLSHVIASESRRKVD